MKIQSIVGKTRTTEARLNKSKVKNTTNDEHVRDLIQKVEAGKLDPGTMRDDHKHTELLTLMHRYGAFEPEMIVDEDKLIKLLNSDPVLKAKFEKLGVIRYQR